MKSITLLAAAAVVFLFAHSAQAHVYHHRYAHYRHYADRHYVAESGYGAAPQDAMMERRSHAGEGGRPAAWCGWEMRQLVSSDPGQAFNLARNWAHWGQPGPAGVGAVVVWAHHVGKIVGEESGQWIIESGNDDHAVRTRARSIAGAIAIRWG